MSPIFTLPMYEPAVHGFIAAQPLLNGDAGVEQTIALMRQLVDEALRDPSFIRWATDVVRSVPAFDDFAEAEALYNWVRDNVRFTKDPVNKEKLYPPTELLKIRAGDCDDISMLLAAGLMAVGYPARLVTVATPSAPEQFSHVYVEAEIPAGSNQWVAIDPARFDSEFGVPPPVTTRARWWSLTDGSYGDLSGTKIFAHPGATVHVNLGNYPRFRSGVSGLGSYGSVRRLGDVAPATSGDTTSSLIATTGQAASDIIRASQGIQASPVQYQSGPWASFATPYTPGVTVGPGGYGTPNVALTASSNWVLWVALGFGALLLLGGRR